MKLPHMSNAYTINSTHQHVPKNPPNPKKNKRNQVLGEPIPRVPHPPRSLRGQVAIKPGSPAERSEGREVRSPSQGRGGNKSLYKYICIYIFIYIYIYLHKYTYIFIYIYINGILQGGPRKTSSK